LIKKSSKENIRISNDESKFDFGVNNMVLKSILTRFRRSYEQMVSMMKSRENMTNKVLVVRRTSD
jgi:hypothetical protein